MDRTTAKIALISLLKKAYSGELAAAYAYEGHGKNVRDSVEMHEIETIRKQELEHRQRVGEMLAELGAGPSRVREIILTVIGRSISILCYIGGWFIPMYGAGKLERQNIVEYEHAARHVMNAGYLHFIDDLLTMAEVEWDHELYFRSKAASHFLWKVFPNWPPPPPRLAIRNSFPFHNQSSVQSEIS